LLTFLKRGIVKLLDYPCSIDVNLAFFSLWFSHLVFALYLVHLIQQGSSVSLLNFAIYEASWVLKQSGYPELSDHPLVQQVARAGRRILDKPLNRKALEVNQVRKIITRLGQGNLGEVQVLLHCLH